MATVGEATVSGHGDDVLVVGDAIVDFVFGGIDRLPDPGEETVASQYELRPGGSGGYASMGLSALGVDTRVATFVGDDELSDSWLDFVKNQGLNTAGVERIENETISAAAAFLLEDERSFLTYRGATDTDRTLSPSVADAGAVLVAGFSQAPYLWADEMVTFIQGLANEDIPVFLDTNWSPSGWRGAFDEVVATVDYLLVNDREARKLGEAEDVATAGRELVEQGVETCVVKTGAKGCTVVSTDGVQRVGTDRREAVDACGAGDFFNAGFVAGKLAGQPDRGAAAVGNRCAGAAITEFALTDKLAGIASLGDAGE